MFLDYYREIDWRLVLRRLWSEIWKDDVFGHAAQLSYYLLFSLFPGLLIISVILGYVARGLEMRQGMLDYAGRMIPGPGFEMVSRTLEQVLQNAGGGKLSIGIATSLWAASSGMSSIIAALNKAYEIREGRPWWRERGLAAILTAVLTLQIVIALAFLLYGSSLARWIGTRFSLGAWFGLALKIARLPLAIGFAMTGFLVVYRFAPNLKNQKWRWIMPGALAGVALWLIVSLALRLYLKYFPTYSTVYGSLGAVLILLLWLYLSSAALLIGGELNSEIENAAAKSGRTDAKLPGEKAPLERERRLSQTQLPK